MYKKFRSDWDILEKSLSFLLKILPYMYHCGKNTFFPKKSQFWVSHASYTEKCTWHLVDNCGFWKLIFSFKNDLCCHKEPNLGANYVFFYNWAKNIVKMPESFLVRSGHSWKGYDHFDNFIPSYSTEVINKI